MKVIKIIMVIALSCLSLHCFAASIPCPSMNAMQAAANKIDDGTFGEWGYRALSHSKISVGDKEWMFFSVGKSRLFSVQDVIQKGQEDLKTIFLQLNDTAFLTEDLYVCLYLTSDKHAVVMAATPIDSVKVKK